MSTPVPYKQNCPIARGLDLLGDRWTMLIVRELSVGPQRFSDLQRNLPGIAATVLTDRLRSMSQDGLVETVPSDPPSRRNLYALGPLGHRALPVLSSLLRFGMPFVELPTKHNSEQPIERPQLTIVGAITAYHDPTAASSVDTDQRYEIRVDGAVFTLDPNAHVVDESAAPDLLITGPSRALIEIRQHLHTFDDLVRVGTITWTGSAEALANFRSIYKLGPGEFAPAVGGKRA